MAGANGIRAGQAFVEATLDDSKLTANLRTAQAKLHSWAKGLAAIGATLAGLGASMSAPVIAATHAYVNASSALVDMSDRVGVSVEALSALKFAAEQSGASVDTLEIGLKGMSKVLDAAAQGSSKATQTLDRLGLSVGDLMKMKPEDRFLALADAISKVEDPGERAALAMKVFGKSGTELLPMLKNGAAGIKVLMDRARELGIVLDDETARQAEALGDKFDQLKVAMGGVSLQIGAIMIPYVDKLYDKLLEFVPVVSTWISENEGLVLALGATAAAASGAGAMLLAMGASVKAASMAFGLMATASAFITGLPAKITAVSASLTTMGFTAATAWGVATAGVAVFAAAIPLGIMALVAMDAKFGIFDSAKERIQQFGESMEKRLVPTMARVAGSVDRMMNALEPLAPFLEIVLVEAVNSLANQLEFLVIQVEMFATSLENALKIANVMGAPLGINFGGGTAAPPETADGKAGAAAATPAPVGPPTLPMGDAEAAINGAAEATQGATGAGVGGRGGLSDVAVIYLQSIAETSRESARALARIVQRGGLTYEA